MSAQDIQQREMPRYQSHKVVHALKIKSIGKHALPGNTTPEQDGQFENSQEFEGAFLVPEDIRYGPIPVTSEWYRKHLQDADSSHGYYIVYPDGYTSWSPVDSFESGYTSVNRLQSEAEDPNPFSKKTLHNSDISGAKVNVPDIKVVGNGDLWQLLCKASSEREGWMKSTKAMEIPGGGCLVQVTTQQRNVDGTYSVAEAIQFVPLVRIAKDDNSGRRLAFLDPPDADKLVSAKGSTGSDNPNLYQKKAVFVEAFQWNEVTAADFRSGIIPDVWPEWLRNAASMRKEQQGALFLEFEEPDRRVYVTKIHTLEGDHTVSIGDFIIQGIQGELYPCKPDIFEATYNKA